MKKMLIAVASMLGVVAAQAEVIVAYHTNPSAVDSAVPSVQGTGITAGNQVFVNSGSSETWRADVWGHPSSPAGISGANTPWRLWRAMGNGDPVSTTSYEGFTISYTGATLTFSAFEFDMMARGGNAAFDAKYAVFASKNAGAFSLLGSGFATAPASAWVNIGLPVSVDISSLGSLNNGDSVEFRLAINGSDQMDEGIFTQGIQVSAIPAPATFGIVLSTLAAVIIRRRRMG